MEIEAKFAVPDSETFQRLQTIDQLAGFALGTGRVKQVHDTYLDTPGQLILAAGYACRRREQDGRILMTLKGLETIAGAVQRREELEVTLSSNEPPLNWPEGPARDKALQIVGEELPSPLFDLHQVRTVRQVSRQDQPIAELSLDQVRVAIGDREQTYLELEVELQPAGSEEELAVIAACLQTEWRLHPEPRSKFERALNMVQQQMPTTGLLTPQERAICARVAARNDLYNRRARAMLGLDAGASQVKAGAQARLSARQVRYWLHEFRQKRLGIFPSRILAEAEALTSARTETASVEIVSPPESPVESPQPALPDKPGIETDDSMAEAARKTLIFHFQRMIAHEPGTRLGENIEELHDMRVATRRMRAALRVFGDYLDSEAMKPFAKALRRTGRTLGAVRDLDVFREKARRYLDTLPVERQAELEPLLAVWQVEHDQAREQMLAYLDSNRYAHFKQQFGEFLQTPGAGALPMITPDGQPLPSRVRYLLPSVLYRSLAVPQAFDQAMSEPGVPLVRFHQLRIAFKGLRYTLEFFQEVLGPKSKPLINQMKRLQDHLGDLQDAVMTCNVLSGFLTWGTWGPSAGETPSAPAEMIVAPGVAAYLAYKQTEIQQLVHTFPPVWEPIRNSEFSRQLAALVAEL
jgi:CHAD domain-containing protein